MKTILKDLVILAVVLAVIVGGLYLAHPAASAPTQTPTASVAYSCDGGKTIHADYYQGTSTPPANPGEPPVPGGSVALVLSDGRAMTLPQTISASGIRYANADESFIFWSKGSGAFVMENNAQTFANCVQQ